MNYLLVALVLMPALQQTSFKETQLKQSRVKTATRRKKSLLNNIFLRRSSLSKNFNCS